MWPVCCCAIKRIDNCWPRFCSFFMKRLIATFCGPCLYMLSLRCAAEEKPHHRWMAASVAEATYEQQEFEQYEAIAQAEMKAHRL